MRFRHSAHDIAKFRFLLAVFFDLTLTKSVFRAAQIMAMAKYLSLLYNVIGMMPFGLMSGAMVKEVVSISRSSNLIR